MCVVLTANSPDEALGVVSAVVMAHDDMSTTFVEPMARAFTQARISPVVSTVARILASFEGRNKNALSVVICFLVGDNSDLFQSNMSSRSYVNCWLNKYVISVL